MQVTWINTGTFSLYLIPWALRSTFSARKAKQGNGDHGRSGSEDAGNDEYRSEHSDASQEELPLTDHSAQSPLIGQGQNSLLVPETAQPSVRGASATSGRPRLATANSIRTFGSQDVVARDDLTPLTTIETAKLGCVFSMLWFAANYFGQCPRKKSSFVMLTWLGNISLSYTNVASL